MSAPPTQAAVVSNLPLRTVATNSNDSSSPVLLPDWQSISFSSMPPIGESGSIDLPTGGIRQWTAGQTPDKYLQLGDIDEALRPDLASLSSIAQMVSNLNLKQTALNSFPLAGQQTLKHLADIVPSLAGLSIDRIPPVATLLSSSGMALPNTSTTLSNLLQQYPQLGNLQLKSIDLSKFSIPSIPNLDLVQLGQFKDWQSSLVDRVPGLKDLPLAYFPQPLTELGDVVARIDSIYSKAERERQRTVSGSNAVGFSYPCSGQDCAYIELDDLENQGRNTHSSFEGRSWISGKYQKVPGGSGCLKWVNGGKEPTGRHPFGKAFKVAVMEPDEKTDTVNTALFFRFKNLCGATPYFVGPVPFITYSLNDPIFVGIWDADKDSNSGTATPRITSTTSKETQPSSTTPSAADSTQPEPQDCNDANFDPTNIVQNVAIDALADAIATTESDAVYDAIGSFTVADRGQNRGRALGMYQMMSYEPSVVAAVSRHSGGDAWLKDLSKGKQPTKDELLTYFPPADQEAVFRQFIKNKIETTAAEIDPTTGELFTGDRLVQRVAQKYFGGDASHVDSGATDSFGRLNTYTYGLNVSQQYSQQLGLADNSVPCTTVNDSTDSAGTTTNVKELSTKLPTASNTKKSNTRSGASSRTTSYPDRQTLLAYISPADLLDYFGLTYDVVERMYIELNYKEGQEKDFALLMNAIATALDAIGVVVPGAGGGGTSFRAAMAVAPGSAAAIWRTIPAAAKQRIYAEVARTLRWSSARAVQMTNAFFSAMNAEGEAGGGSESSSSSGGTRDSEVRDLLAQGDPVVKAAIERAGATPNGTSRINTLVRAMKKKPAIPQSFKRGKLFGKGNINNVYEMEGNSTLLIKPGRDAALAREAEAMVEMEMSGIPTVFVKKTVDNGEPALILQKIDGKGSRSIIGAPGKPLNPPQNTEVVTQKTLDDLELIYRQLQKNNFNIGDFQFIVRKSDGAVFVNDPTAIQRGKPPGVYIENIIQSIRNIVTNKN